MSVAFGAAGRAKPPSASAREEPGSGPGSLNRSSAVSGSEEGPGLPPGAPASPPGPPRTGRWKKLLLIALGACVGCAAVGALVAFLVFRHYAEGLPSVETLKSGYDPPQISRILASDGTLLSSVFTERRTVIPFSEIPDATKLAFLARQGAGRGPSGRSCRG